MVVRTIFDFLLCLLVTGSVFAQQETVQWQYMDTTVKPVDDFFSFANGRWLDTAKIPSNKTVVGRKQDDAGEIFEQIKNIINTAINTKNKPGSNEQIVADFFRSGMDTANIEKRGLSPLAPLLEKIDAVQSTKGLIAMEAFLNRLNDPVIFGNAVYADLRNNNINSINFYEAGIYLPLNYYVNADASLTPVKNVYIKLLAKMIELSGDRIVNFDLRAQKVFELETALASAWRSSERMREIEKNYQKLSVQKLNTDLPNLHFGDYIKTLGAKTDTVVVYAVDYYKKLDTLVATQPLSVWKDLFKTRQLINKSPMLSAAFRNARFEFQREYVGEKAEASRESSVIREINLRLGETLGKLYAQHYFPPSSKYAVMELVKYVKLAFAERLRQNTWMEESTKAKALEKLTALRPMMGYPDEWQNFPPIKIVPGKYFENVLATDRSKADFYLGNINKPVNKSHWLGNRWLPQIISARALLNSNAVLFSASMLNSYFNSKADPALNYAQIGAVIGHEISHNFDNGGVKYDKDGNFTNWWTDGDYKRFKEKTQQVINLYNGFTMLDTLHLNGTMGAGENIGDIAGLALAHSAFMLQQKDHTSPVINGYTPEQRFFIAYAQQFRMKYTNEAIKMRINSDPHSPPKYRVIGPLMNFDPFYKAFNVQPGDKMYLEPAERIRIW